MGDKILLIEILDSDIVALLTCFRQIFNEKDFSTGIHITIKGPQKTFRTKSIDKFLETNNPIKIYSVGMFINQDNYIVYLKAQGEDIKGHMWNKPDYKDDFNPHITIYSGENKKLAKIILKFLKEENITLECKKYIIVVHTLKQPSLFKQEIIADESGFKTLIQKGIVSADILKRARNLMANYEKSC